MKTDQQFISLGAMVAFSGFVLSGPVSFLLVQWLHPQPAWHSAAVFVRYYHPLQNLSYLSGFILAGGMLMIAVGHYLNATHTKSLVRFHVLLSVVWTTIFSALIFFNYICQVSFIPHLVDHYHPVLDSTIAIFSMANPLSLSWSIEMWGYATLGIASWHLSLFYRQSSRKIYYLLIANGIVSILSAVLFTINKEWLFGKFGLSSFFIWNLLMMVLLLLIYRHAKQPDHGK
jgi:hypothetical protein